VTFSFARQPWSLHETHLSVTERSSKSGIHALPAAGFPSIQRRFQLPQSIACFYGNGRSSTEKERF
jgi:hypothetical protein